MNWTFAGKENIFARAEAGFPSANCLPDARAVLPPIWWRFGRGRLSRRGTGAARSRGPYLLPANSRRPKRRENVSCPAPSLHQMGNGALHAVPKCEIYFVSTFFGTH